jgi:hypothetical protein
MNERSLLSAGVYAILFVLGVAEGMVGSFQFSRTAGPVPVAALAFCLIILITCMLAGWALRGISGALVPGIGWILASFLLSMPVSNGSVIITNSGPGKWYLYGGTICVLAGVAITFGLWVRREARD